MRIIQTIILVLSITLVGCAPGRLHLDIDPSLETDAQVYEIDSPGYLFDKRLNISFGSYSVAEADTVWITTKTSSADDTPWLLELLGLRSSDAKKREISMSTSYEFNVVNGPTWKSQCEFLKIERESEDDDVVTIDVLSSNYTCNYSSADKESWILSIEKDGLSPQSIEMTNNKEIFRAQTAGGSYVTADGRSSELFALMHAGYTWTHENNDVAAVSIQEKKPRVWLDKRNPDTMNDVLSMASAGLLIYRWTTGQH